MKFVKEFFSSIMGMGWWSSGWPHLEHGNQCKITTFHPSFWINKAGDKKGFRLGWIILYAHIFHTSCSKVSHWWGAIVVLHYLTTCRQQQRRWEKGNLSSPCLWPSSPLPACLHGDAFSIYRLSSLGQKCIFVPTMVSDHLHYRNTGSNLEAISVNNDWLPFQKVSNGNNKGNLYLDTTSFKSWIFSFWVHNDFGR